MSTSTRTNQPLKVDCPGSACTQNRNELDIINLSSHPLSQDEDRVLKLSLTFCPDENADKFELIKDLHVFARHLMYKVLYDKESNTVEFPCQPNSNLTGVTFEDLKALQDLMDLWDESNPEEVGYVFNPSGVGSGVPCTLPMVTRPFLLNILGSFSFGAPKTYKPKSRSFPILQGNSNIWAFMIQVTKEIESTNLQQGSAPNLSKNFKQALHNLSSNKNIVIKPSDKGGNLVIMDTDQYERMCYDIILNKTWYRSVPVSHVNYYATKYYDIIARVKNKGTIDQKNF